MLSAIMPSAIIADYAHLLCTLIMLSVTNASVSKKPFKRIVIMLNVVMLSIVIFCVVMLSVVMLSVIYAECHYTECHYAECHYA
jgi:hypothetical protein